MTPKKSCNLIPKDHKNNIEQEPFPLPWRFEWDVQNLPILRAANGNLICKMYMENINGEQIMADDIIKSGQLIESQMNNLYKQRIDYYNNIKISQKTQSHDIYLP